MKTIIIAFALALLAGCAGQDEKDKPSTQDITQAVNAEFNLQLQPQLSVD